MKRLSRRLALAAIGLAACAVGAAVLSARDGSPLEPATPPAVAFTRGGDIWTTKPDGSSARRVTRTREFREGAPAWSPDGRAIVYERKPARQLPQDPTPPALVVGGLDGDARVVSGPDGGSSPAWSPDGSRIAYATRRGLWTVAPDGRERRSLGVAGGCPVWSPDGARIAYCGVGATTNGTSVWTVDAQGGDQRQITRASAEDTVAAWSPDGKRLAFTSDRSGDGDVYVVGADGHGLRAVVRSAGPQSASAWLPDGRILFVDWSGRRSRWGLVNADRGATEWLPRLAGVEEPIGWLGRAKAVPRDRRASGPSRRTGTLVSIGKARALFLDCRGRGSPTVVFDSGLGVDSQTWLAVQQRVSATTRACRYDRLGLGLSSRPARSGRTALELAGELHELLTRARTRAPLVLVGASFGGLTVQLYQSRHPADVAGLVLVDSLAPDFDRRIERLLRPAQREARRGALAANGEGIRFADIVRSEAQVAGAATRLEIPLVVIRHGLPFEGGAGFPSPKVERLWRELQLQTARRSTAGSVVVARRSRHRIAESEPAVVARAVERLVRDARR